MDLPIEPMASPSMSQASPRLPPAAELSKFTAPSAKRFKPAQGKLIGDETSLVGALRYWRELYRRLQPRPESVDNRKVHLQLRAVPVPLRGAMKLHWYQPSQSVQSVQVPS